MDFRSSKKIFSFYFAVLVKLHSEIQLKVLLNVRCSEFRRGRQDQCYSLRVYINLVQAHTVIYNTIKIFVVLLIQIYFNSHAAYFWIYKKDSSLYSCMVMRAVSKHCWHWASLNISNAFHTLSKLLPWGFTFRPAIVAKRTYSN